MTNTAQLVVFAYVVNEDIHVVEDFVQLIAMMGTTTGADILKALRQYFEVINWNLSNCF